MLKRFVIWLTKKVLSPKEILDIGVIRGDLTTIDAITAINTLVSRNLYRSSQNLRDDLFRKVLDICARRSMSDTADEYLREMGVLTLSRKQVLVSAIEKLFEEQDELHGFKYPIVVSAFIVSASRITEKNFVKRRAIINGRLKAVLPNINAGTAALLTNLVIAVIDGEQKDA